MKLRFQQVAVLLLCAFLLVSALPIRSTDADYTANTYVSGSSADVTIFYVTTESQSNCKIKFSATKGTMNIITGKWFGNAAYSSYYNAVTENKPDDTKKMYEYFSILVEKINMQKEVLSREEYLMEDGSETISLERDSHYRITVTPLFYSFSRDWVGKKYIANLTYNPYKSTSGFILTRIVHSVQTSKWLPTGWNKHATWEISSTRGVAACSTQPAVQQGTRSETQQAAENTGESSIFCGNYRVFEDKEINAYYDSVLRIDGEDFFLRLQYQFRGAGGYHVRTQTFEGKIIEMIEDTCCDEVTYVAHVQFESDPMILPDTQRTFYLDYYPDINAVSVYLELLGDTFYGLFEFEEQPQGCQPVSIIPEGE